MKKQEILKGIIEELKSMSLEKPKDFYYRIDGYVDDYDGHDLSSLAYEWEKNGHGKFKNIFPITTLLISELKKANDGIEREESSYKDLIDLSKKALEEIRQYSI